MVKPVPPTNVTGNIKQFFVKRLMAKNISFSLTTDQIRNQTKTVTRRVNWWENKNGRRLAKVGDLLNACVKCMGLKPGESIEKICQIRITDIRREPLELMDTIPSTVVNNRIVQAGFELPCPTYGYDEAKREGFPDMTGSEFVKMFCKNMNCLPYDFVTRIEFEYV